MHNLKISSDQGKDDTSTNRTSAQKPSGAPNSNKDFKKIMGEKDRGQDDGSQNRRNANLSADLDSAVDTEEIAFTEENQKQQQPSLFDLSKGILKKNANDATADVINMASSDELQMESPSSIFKNLTLKEKAAQAKGANSGKGINDLEADGGKKSPTRFPQESIDLSYVNPLALNTTSISQIGDQKLENMPSSQKMTTQQLVDAIVKAITTIETQGKTDTVVTLKQPPMFAGANVVLTSYESAKGEFNIRFENLTQQAKSFMDMQQNQDSLRFALQQKGYAVHILVATTLIESPQMAANPQQTSRDQNQQEEEQKKQQGRPQQDDEEA